MKTCLICETKLSGRSLKYCSPKCRTESRKSYQDCLTCGKSSTNKYCSSGCLELAYRKPKEIRTCSVCTEAFEARDINSRYCSDKCVKLKNIERAKKYRTPALKVTGVCVICKSEFVGPKGKKYCSSSCSKKASRKPRPKKSSRSLDCPSCGLSFETSHPTKKFCSRKCNRMSPEYKARQRAYTIKVKDEREDSGLSRNKRSKTEAYKLNRKLSKRTRDKRVRQATLSCVNPKDFADLEARRGLDQDLDHIIPLNHELVCGLNVPWNIQILTKSENNLKSNSFDGTCDNESWMMG